MWTRNYIIFYLSGILSFLVIKLSFQFHFFAIITFGSSSLYFKIIKTVQSKLLVIIMKTSDFLHMYAFVRYFDENLEVNHTSSCESINKASNNCCSSGSTIFI